MIYNKEDYVKDLLYYPARRTPFIAKMQENEVLKEIFGITWFDAERLAGRERTAMLLYCEARQEVTKEFMESKTPKKPALNTFPTRPPKMR